MSRDHGRRRGALTYVLTSAALATAFAAGPAVMLTGAAAQAGLTGAAAQANPHFVSCPTHHISCQKKPECC
jgi:hypothetical protein